MVYRRLSFPQGIDFVLLSLSLFFEAVVFKAAHENKEVHSAVLELMEPALVESRFS